MGQLTPEYSDHKTLLYYFLKNHLMCLSLKDYKTVKLVFKSIS